MSEIQYYRWAIVLPGIILSLAASVAVALLPGLLVLGVLAAAFGDKQGLEYMAGMGFFLAFMSPGLVACQLVVPLYLFYMWRLSEAGYRKSCRFLPLTVAVVALLGTTVLMHPVGTGNSFYLGLFVAIPTAIAGYAYLVVASILLSLLRAFSFVKPASDAAPPRGTGVIVAAAVSLACGLGLFALAMVSAWGEDEDSKVAAKSGNRPAQSERLATGGGSIDLLERIGSSRSFDVRSFRS